MSYLKILFIDIYCHIDGGIESIVANATDTGVNVFLASIQLIPRFSLSSQVSDESR